ncbi:immunoglobulin superfamily member 11-like [Conger conger]|uniref:immunoglobulin superfamily member 11-like n=1 Tax=Conger conger TaxID=82655 RepID=UPI002A5A8A17|nr:immunoglobulin superfamily member 11-like [Conger conger]
MGFPHFYVLVGLLLAMPAVSQFEVKYANVGHPITLTCSGAPRRDVEWYFEQHLHSHRLLVAKLHAGCISPGPDFEGRVESVCEEQPGNYSLVLSPVVYNDQGSYECRDKGSLLKEVKLVVIVPGSVSIALGMSANLPCYGGISKRARAVDLDILWKRDGQIVYQRYNNTITYGPGFESRASVSPEQALHGNLSLTIKQTRFSDQGHYQCFYSSPKESGNPDSARLHVTDPPPQNLTVKAGEELSIRLRTTDPVRVTFTGPGLDEVLMVDANVTYGERCGQRCEVLGQENTFLLRRVTPEDAGVYTVTDSETNRTISIVSLQISGETTGAVPWIVSTVLFSCICLGLAVWMHCSKRRGAEQRIVYQPAAVEDLSSSSGRTELQQPGGPEPSLSVTETRIDVPEPHLPVSETGPSDQTRVQEKKSEEVQGTRPWSMND